MKLLIFVLLCSYSAQHECGNGVSCLVSDKKDTPLSLLQIETNDTEETTTEFFTTEETETTTTVRSTPQPTPTLSPMLKPSYPSAVCWCDHTANYCDINCCCDSECSVSQKQVFTHCTDQTPVYDEKHCYSSNFFFRKPSDVKSVHNQGLFCIVRDNLSTMKEFQARDSIKTVEEFEKTMRKSDRFSTGRNSWVSKFSHQAYKAGSLVWSVSKGNLTPFHVTSRAFGDLCLTKLPVTFLNNMDTECVWRIPRTEPKCSEAVADFISKLQSPIVTSPLLINVTDIKSSIANCSSTDACTPLRTFLCKPSKKCTRFEKLKPSDCAHLGLDVTVNFLHNGTEGIQSASAFIRLLNTSVLKTSVNFVWSDAESDGFVRSGNPGYKRGRPILSGRKVSSVSNDTTGKKEAMEITVSPKGWLTTFTSTKGKCSPERQPILFDENLRQLCHLQLERKYFSKNGCIELQRVVLEFLIQADKVNLTNLNKYLGVYGSARVEVISDWLQMMVDYFPLMSTQPTFGNASHGLACRGIFTHVYFDIAIAKFGSFYNPQFKIIGGLVRFAPAQDFLVRCTNVECQVANTIKLMSEVNFMDVSKQAERRFAQPPGLEAKLPHDFFYPFFAFNCSILQSFSRVLLLVSVLIVGVTG